jgi:AcrR family transcriptional regulator
VQRSTRWGDTAPATDDEARDRLLDAAETCYARHGVARTTVDDIAAAASVHRTTVYKYFPGRDEILVGVLLRDSEQVIAGAERQLRGDGSFAERMAGAFRHASKGIRDSTYLRLLFSPEAADLTVRVASASEQFRARTERALLPFVEDAIDRGELRTELGAQEVVSWLVRASFMLLLEHGGQAGTGAVRDMERFVLPGLGAIAGTSQLR